MNKQLICAGALAATALLMPDPVAAGASPHIRVGHVGHDHHLALFVAADHSARSAGKAGFLMRPVKKHKLYELLKGKRKLATVELIKVGGGSKMPTALAQGVIDVGLGGTAPVLAAVDKGAPLRLIAPLHNKGDMFVLAPTFPADTWQEFVEKARKAQEPIRIGYKSPVAVAKVIFEEALKHEGLTFSGNVSDRNVNVRMINVKGGGKLNASLAAGLVDGYAGNNPFPAIGEEKKILKIVIDIEDLPPRKFKNHPCCCVAANNKATETKKEIITALLVLLIQGTELINRDIDIAATSAAEWIGTTEKVEKRSIPTSGYSMAASKEWHEQMKVWLAAMNELGIFSGKLKNLDEKRVAAIACDLALLREAWKHVED